MEKTTLVHARCPCCGHTHRRNKLHLQTKNLAKSYERDSFVWTQTSVQGDDGRWRAGEGEPVEDERAMETFAKRCREFLKWYEGE